MKVKEVRSRINNIETCQKTLEIFLEKETEPFYKDTFKSCKNMLEEYKILLLREISKKKTDK